MVRQILHSYSRRHEIRMRLLTLESLRHHGLNLDTDVLEHLDITSTILAPVPCGILMKVRRCNVSDIMDFCRVLKIPFESIYRELIRHSRHNLTTQRGLPEDPEIHR